MDNDDTPPAAASASTVTSRGSVGRRGAVTESQLMDAVLPGPSNDAGSTLPASITAALVRLSLSYLITDCRVPELIPVLGSQPAGDVSHKLGSRLPLLSARPAVNPRNPYCLVNRGSVNVNSLPKTVTRQCRSSELNPDPTAPESSMLTTRLPSHLLLVAVTGKSQS